jgi:hypothetical protein
MLFCESKVLKNIFLQSPQLEAPRVTPKSEYRIGRLIYILTMNTINHERFQPQFIKGFP